MGKDAGTSTVTENADPWVGQQPYLKEGFKTAQNNLNSPQQYFPDRGYIPFSDQTEKALGMAENRAMGSPVERGMQSWATNTMANPGGGGTQNFLNNAMTGAPGAFAPRNASGAYNTLGKQGGPTPGFTSGLDSFSGSTPNISGPLTNFAQGGGMGQTPFGALNSSAKGEMLNANPYLDKMFGAASKNVTDKFSESVSPAINAAFGAAGRTGGGAHGDVMGNAAGELSDSLGSMAANIYGNNYSQERGRQMNAANSMNQYGLAQRGQNLGALGQAAGIDSGLRGQNLGALGQSAGLNANMYNANQNRGLQGAQSLINDNFNRMQAGANYGLGAANASTGLLGTQGGISQGAAALAPTAAGLDWQNINQMGNVGQRVEGKGGEVLQDRMNRWNFGQQQPDEALARYIAAIQGNYGGTSQSTQKGPGGNPLAGLAGGAMTGAGLGSMMGAGSGLAGGAALGAMAPWMLGGGLLGGLLGL